MVSTDQRELQFDAWQGIILSPGAQLKSGMNHQMPLQDYKVRNENVYPTVTQYPLAVALAQALIDKRGSKKNNNKSICLNSAGDDTDTYDTAVKSYCNRKDNCVALCAMHTAIMTKQVEIDCLMSASSPTALFCCVALG